MISVENLYQGNFNNYHALYIEISYPISRKGLYLQPSGYYLRAFVKVVGINYLTNIKKSLDYAEQQGLSLYEYAYETGINETVIDNFDDYITQIEIPIKVK